MVIVSLDEMYGFGGISTKKVTGVDCSYCTGLLLYFADLLPAFLKFSIIFLAFNIASFLNWIGSYQFNIWSTVNVIGGLTYWVMAGDSTVAVISCWN